MDGSENHYLSDFCCYRIRSKVSIAYPMLFYLLLFSAVNMQLQDISLCYKGPSKKFIELLNNYKIVICRLIVYVTCQI